MSGHTFKITRPGTNLTGAAKHSFNLAVEAILSCPYRTLWGTDNQTIVFDDPHRAGITDKDKEKTIRTEITVLTRDQIEPGKWIATASHGDFYLAPERIQHVNDDGTMFTTRGSPTESKYELKDGAWYRTEYTPDQGWSDREELDEPIPVAVVDQPEREQYEYRHGDDQRTYQ